MTSRPPHAPHRGSGPAGLLAPSAGCLGAVLLLGVLLAADLLVRFFQTVQDTGHDRARDSRAEVVAAADRLRARLRQADADGTLTDRELTAAPASHSVRSLDRNPSRTVVVVRVAAADWAQCYAYTATPTGSVTSRPLDVCPEPSPSATLPSV